MKNEEINIYLESDDGTEDTIKNFNPDELEGYLKAMLEGIKKGLWNKTTVTIEIGNIKGTE